MKSESIKNNSKAQVETMANSRVTNHSQVVPETIWSINTKEFLVGGKSLSGVQYMFHSYPELRSSEKKTYDRRYEEAHNRATLIAERNGYFILKTASAQMPNARQNKDFSLKEFLAVLNDVRMNPEKYIELIDTWTETKVAEYSQRISEIGSWQIEHGKAFNDARDCLIDLCEKPQLKPLRVCRGLTAAAYQHALYISDRQDIVVEHEGQGARALPKDRIESVGFIGGPHGEIREICSNLPRFDPVYMIMNIIFDQKNKARINQKNFLCPDNMLVGIGIVRTPGERGEWHYVLNFAELGYKPFDDLIDPDILVQSGYIDFLSTATKAEYNQF